MSQSRPESSAHFAHVPLIVRPIVSTLDDALKYGTALRRGPIAWMKNRRKVAWQKENLGNFERSLHDQYKFEHGLKLNALGAIGHLWLAHVSRRGEVTDLGLVSCRVVTDTGVQFIVDAFQNLTELENMRFHGLGTGTTAEGANQTALVTELTTQYSTSSTRPTGTLGEKSGDAKTYETTATITVSAGVAATEHAILSQAAVGGGVMLDRSLFSAVNLASGESLQATYQLTFPSNG